MKRMSQKEVLDGEPASTMGVGLIDKNKAKLFYNHYHDLLRNMGVG